MLMETVVLDTTANIAFDVQRTRAAFDRLKAEVQKDPSWAPVQDKAGKIFAQLALAWTAAEREGLPENVAKMFFRWSQEGEGEPEALMLEWRVPSALFAVFFDRNPSHCGWHLVTKELGAPTFFHDTLEFDAYGIVQLMVFLGYTYRGDRT